MESWLQTARCSCCQIILPRGGCSLMLSNNTQNLFSLPFGPDNVTCAIDNLKKPAWLSSSALHVVVCICCSCCYCSYTTSHLAYAYKGSRRYRMKGCRSVIGQAPIELLLSSSEHLRFISVTNPHHNQASQHISVNVTNP